MAEIVTDKKRKHVAEVGSKSASYPRKKTPVACQVCRARRTKCDADRPCSFCVKIGAICVEEPESAISDGSSDTAILRSLQDLKTQMSSISETLQAFTAARSPGIVSSPRSTLSINSTSEGINVSPGNLEDLLSSKAFDVFQPPQLPSEFNWSRAEAEQVIALSVAVEPGSADSRLYLDCYFSHVHIKNPVFDEDRVRSSYQSICVHGIAWDADSCVILLILANGAISTNSFETSTKEDDDHVQASRIFFSMAQKRIGLLMTENSLMQARCWFLCGVYLMSMIKPALAWRAFLHALAACRTSSSVIAGRNDALAVDDPMDSAESVYWSCWKSERELRYELGVLKDSPHDQINTDYPVLYPNPPINHSEASAQAWYFYLGEISLWRQETDFRAKMQEFSGKPPEAMQPLAKLCRQALDSLSEWQESLPKSLQHRDNEDMDVLQFVLKGRMSYIYELITWPFLYARLNTSETSREDARELMTLGLITHYERLVNNRPGFSHRHHGTWLMSRSSARSACILLLAAHDPSLCAILPKDWRSAVEATVTMLEYWRPDFIKEGVFTRFMRDMLASAIPQEFE